NLLQVLRYTPVAIDVPLVHFLVVDAMLPRFSCIAKDQPALEFVEIAAERFAPLAARGERNRSCAAKRGRVMVLRTCWPADDDGLDIAADVDPVFAAQCGAGQPVERGADGHGHRGRAAD